MKISNNKANNWQITYGKICRENRKFNAERFIDISAI